MSMVLRARVPAHGGGCWYSAKDVYEITFEPVNWNEADA